MSGLTESFNASDILMHSIFIAIEFGILHSTPLGPMLTGFFGNIWSGLGMEFAAEAGVHALPDIAASGAVEEVAHGGMCHFHGSEMVCH